MAVIVMTCGSCTTAASEQPRTSSSTDIGANPAVFVALEDGRLVAVSPADGSLLGTTQLAEPGDAPAASGHVLALNVHRRHLYALTGGRDDRASVAVLDARNLALLNTWPLPPGLRHRVLVRGAATGTVLVFGDRAEPNGRSAWLTKLDEHGRIVGPWQLRAADTRDWVPYAAAVSDDETYALVSYHGERTTGADVVRLTDPPSAACATPDAPGRGCLAHAHGNVDIHAGRVVATTGDGDTLMVADPVDGTQRHVAVGLPGNHLMEFAIAADGPVYVLGSCLYAGGLSQVDLDAPTPRVLASAQPGVQNHAVCGERLATGPNRMIAVIRGPPLTASPAPPALDLVDGVTGRVRATAAMPARPVDVAVG